MTITYILIGITCLISYSCFQNQELLSKLAHRPILEHQGQYHRLLSSGFVHGSTGHLMINMFVLYQFGGFIEQYFSFKFGDSLGPITYVLFYLVAIVFANLGTYTKHASNSGFSSVGASGVTSALIILYCFFDPWQMFLFPPVPAIIFAVLYIGYSHWASNNSSDNIDHQGHLWGTIFGLLFILVFDRSLLGHFINQLADLPF